MKNTIEAFSRERKAGFRICREIDSRNEVTQKFMRNKEIQKFLLLEYIVEQNFWKEAKNVSHHHSRSLKFEGLPAANWNCRDFSRGSENLNSKNKLVNRDKSRHQTLIFWVHNNSDFIRKLVTGWRRWGGRIPSKIQDLLIFKFYKRT